MKKKITKKKIIKKIVEKSEAIEKAPEKLYTATLTLGPDVYTYKADTILECLENIVPKTIVKSHGGLVFQKADKRMELRLNLFQVRRLANNKYYRQIMEGRINSLLG